MKKGDKDDLFFVINYSHKGGCAPLQYTKEQEQYIIEQYLLLHNISIIAKQFNVSDYIIRKILKNANVKLLTRQEQCKQLYPRNSNYFERIDSSEKAYWLGFLYADGSVNSKYEIRISLKTEDEVHLCKFLKAINGENILIKRNDKIINNKLYPISFISFKDKTMFYDLQKLGCVVNKTKTLKFPSNEQVPHQFLTHFIRGFFDGDGSLYCTNGRYAMNFTGTEDMLTHIKEFLNKTDLKLEHKTGCCVLHICGNRQLKRILDLLYEESNENIELTRKKQIYNRYLLQCFGGEPVIAGCGASC